MLQRPLHASGSMPPEAMPSAPADSAADLHTPEPQVAHRGESSPPQFPVRRSSRIAAISGLRDRDSSSLTIGPGRRNISRPSIVLTNLFSQSADVVFPSVENADENGIETPYLSVGDNPIQNGLLSAFQAPANPRLQTPEPMSGLCEGYTPARQKSYGESIVRTSSAFSVSSSSSEESNLGSADQFSVSGSTTSPETEAPTPFGSMYKRIRPAAALDYGTIPSPPKPRRRQPKTLFTKAMDQHLWAAFIKYIENPQMAPFAMRPGQSPPGGVQHLVARQARRTWRGGDAGDASFQGIARKKSSDTLVPSDRSNQMHVEYSVVGKTWPSKTATRARLRELCREQGRVTPHMQQRLKSRSPTPVSSRARAVPRPSSHNFRFNSLSELADPSAYNTRDVRISLATSTSSTMRRNGPLAQLATRSDEYFEGLGEWFGAASTNNNHAATPPPNQTTFGPELRHSAAASLGSPFGNHTWGPSSGREIADNLRHSDGFHTTAPRLRSPFTLGSGELRNGSNKRRAPTQLEDEPGQGSGSSEAISTAGLEDPFGPAIGTQRRVRSRGATLGDIFAPRHTAGAPQTFNGLPSNHSNTLPSTLFAPPSNLASPFEGITARPNRRSRNMRTETLQVFEDPDAPSSSSIDSRLEQPDCSMTDSS